ncbi:hypothetical protein F5051DRAFT_433085 [Lentinula edodes]|nr:hypothetical protein F5051DRAFT_433085 [Lentinula edodes]
MGWEVIWEVGRSCLADAQDLGEWIGVKGGAVFVPSQNQCQLTADDILAHAAFDTSSNSSTCGGDKTQQQQPSSDRVNRFLNPGIDMANLEKYLEFMSDEGLKEVLGHQDTIVQRLFESGAVQRTSWTQCHGRSHLYDRLPRKLDSSSINYEFTHFETFLLLQAHFSRIHLPAELITNQRLILEKILNLLSANVWLKALSTMAIAQMCVQAVWERDSPLKQIPHFEAEVIRRCADAGLESVYDVMGYGGWKCIDIEVLKMSNAQIGSVTNHGNTTRERDGDLGTIEYPYIPYKSKHKYEQA